MPHEVSELLIDLKKHSPGYLYPIVKLFTETAAKTSEVIDLNWQDLDLDQQIVRFKKQVKIQARTLELSSEFVQVLKLLKSNSKTIRVFQTHYKESFTSIKVTRAINEFKAKSDFKKSWSPMDLRHSFAVNFLKEGYSIKELQRILGHNNVYDTKKLYGEIVNESANNLI
jgi:integrase/recombinase XerD